MYSDIVLFVGASNCLRPTYTANTVPLRDIRTSSLVLTLVTRSLASRERRRRCHAYTASPRSKSSSSHTLQQWYVRRDLYFAILIITQVHFLLRKNSGWKGDDKNETYRKLHNSIVNTLKADQKELESGDYDGDYADEEDYNGNVIAWFNRYVPYDLMNHLLTTVPFKPCLWQQLRRHRHHGPRHTAEGDARSRQHHC